MSDAKIVPLPLSTTSLEASLMRLAEAAMAPRHPTKLTRKIILALGPEPQLRNSLTRISSRLRPVTEAQIAAEYAALAALFPTSPALSRDQATAKFRIFCADLGHLTPQALAQACKRYRTEPSPDGRQKFFPQPWQLLELARAEMGDVQVVRAGLQRIAATLDAPDMITAEPRMASAKTIGDFARAFALSVRR
jgi:hypothetical protein